LLPWRIYLAWNNKYNNIYKTAAIDT